MSVLPNAQWLSITSLSQHFVIASVVLVHRANIVGDLCCPSNISLCNIVDSKKSHFVIQRSLSRPTSSSSLGILWQWPQQHHNGRCPAGSWELVHDRFPSQNLAVLRLPVWSSFFQEIFFPVLTWWQTPEITAAKIAVSKHFFPYFVKLWTSYILHKHV